MKMSPMQKYAMRLLIASGQVRLPDRNAWSQLTSETAAEQLRQFGGVQAILRRIAASRLEIHSVFSEEI